MSNEIQRNEFQYGPAVDPIIYGPVAEKFIQADWIALAMALIYLPILGRLAAQHFFGKDGTVFGIGLTGMRERVLALKGRFEISRSPGHGMRLTAVMPLTLELA